MKHLKKFESSFFNNINEMTDRQLVSSFKDAVCDDNYNPTSTPYNDSDFSLEELEEELYRRLSLNDKNNDDIE